MREKLSDLDVQRALSSLPGWSRRGETLTKTLQRRSFAETIELVDQIAAEAERRNHHPDMDIRYTRLTLTLSTHDAGGITQNDLDLAASIERMANE